MTNLMSALSKLSQALDSKNIGEVLLALQNFDEEFSAEKCEDVFVRCLQEIISWDLTVSLEISETVVRQMMNRLENQAVLEEMCNYIIKQQSSVTVEIAVEIMIEHGWILRTDDCREVWKQIESAKNTEKIEILARRMTANCRILRLSGAPKRFLEKLLKDVIISLNANKVNIPMKFLNELAIVSPFHPILVIEDFKKDSEYFYIPHVVSEETRFHLEVKEFTNFFQIESTYHKEQACQMLQVFNQIYKRMELIPQLEAPEIDKIVEFWLAALRIFNGYGIGMNDITESAKLLEKTASRYSLKSRPLFLKHFLKKISEKKDTNIGLEPQVVATIITTYQRNAFGLRSPEFYEELGEFWALCLKIKYDDVYFATVYFSAVFALAQAQAVFKIKKELCREVYHKILQPMHEQLVDFVKLKQVESNKATSEEEVMRLEHQNIGASYFSILTCTYKNAEDRILEFMKEN
ncbi:RAP domain-containing protein [Caenorhabditis elegans]|uniref:RAP domain-containing protein n=1 Tax=Caenorhabditis elegans TaxID=6239 RepID=Q18854_CAEEL|nr:RAP domain-containing protein [Caenorhabditis elegans]CAA99821.1 RAP domain-containing protein [Caenorhabditis elegans]|eukprot:NP_492208.1 Uncharacterized protein CELE_C54G4.9 [Caenorhabditis elegans]